MQIGYRDFTDGQSRAVHLDDDGNQCVFDDSGQAVFGVWIAPDTTDADPPIFLPRDDLQSVCEATRKGPRTAIGRLRELLVFLACEATRPLVPWSDPITRRWAQC